VTGRDARARVLSVGHSVSMSDRTTTYLAFVCAMPVELDPLIRKLGLHDEPAGDLAVQRGVLGDRAVAGIVTGMGTELARRATTRLLDALDVDRVVVVGITGGIHVEIPVGTLVLPEVVVNGATGSEFRPAPLGAGTPSGRMWTSDALITDQDHVEEMRAQGIVALDMETAAVAEVCEARRVPWSVFRVISDRVVDGVVDEEVFHLSKQDGTPDDEAIERYFAAHPERVEDMARLAEDVMLAVDAAADAAIEACTAS